MGIREKEYLLGMIWWMGYMGELHFNPVSLLPVFQVTCATPATILIIQTNLKFTCWKDILG